MLHKNSERIRAYKKAYREQHKDENKVYQKNYRERHRDRVRANARACYRRRRDEMRIRKKAWADKHKDKIKAINLKRNHNLCLDQYEQMIKHQHNRCIICGKKSIALQVDHDHKTNIIRNLLCGNCNRLIGLSRENPITLINAAKYLKKWKILTDKQPNQLCLKYSQGYKTSI